MSINRPEIPISAPRQGYLGYTGAIAKWDIYSYLSSDRTGLTKLSYVGGTNWVVVYENPSSSGVIYFLAMAATNPDTSQHQLFHRVTIDGIAVNDGSIPILALVTTPKQGGLCQVGAIGSNHIAPETARSWTSGYLPWSASVKIEMRASYANLSIVTAYSLGVTG